MVVNRQFCLWSFVLCMALCLCAHPSVVRAGGSGYSSKEIVKLAKELAKKKEMPREKVTVLLKNLKASLNDAWFKKAVKKRPVTGVYVYRAGEGGFVVKFMKGDGLISFKGGKKAGVIYMKSWSAGAQVGGSAVWGVGLVMGLKNQAHFGGDYVGNTSNATAADASAKNAVVLSLDSEESTKAHDIYVIYAARGLSAGVGGAKMTITPDW